MQNLLRQGGMQPLKLKSTYKFRPKGPEIKHFSSPNTKFYLARERVNPQIIYILRPTRLDSNRACIFRSQIAKVSWARKHETPKIILKKGLK